ncbi:MAG: universal stress protein, partial [Candidatus Bathyarchaeota archaeon]|nr:universal stress protein [Candidatus Bathyarchaeota archaeon]
MVKRILVALDGSNAAHNALDFAIKLAEMVSAHVELLTVVPPVFLPSYSIYVLKSEAIADCAKELEIS